MHEQIWKLHKYPCLQKDSNFASLVFCIRRELNSFFFFSSKFVRYLLLCWLQATKCLLNSCIGWIWKQVNHEDFNEGIIQVQAKKKASLNYYA
jgi:hypothetical protein